MSAEEDTVKAERLEYLRGVTDKVIELWPSESRPEVSEDPVELVQAMAEMNQALAEGHAVTVMRLLVENATYRLLVDQETTVVPLGTHIKVAFECGPKPYFASQALSWVASCAAGRSDHLFATFMTSFRADFYVPTLQALCDLASALRDGKAQVTLTPYDENDDPDAQPTTVAIDGESPAAIGE